MMQMVRHMPVKTFNKLCLRAVIKERYIDLDAHDVLHCDGMGRLLLSVFQ